MTDITGHPSLSRPRRVVDPYRLGHTQHGHGEHGGEPVPGTGQGRTGPASKRIIVGYGFWIFLLSDIVMFSAFFAAYAVLHGQTAGGPSGAQIFDPSRVAVQTACLLISSFFCGVAAAAVNARNQLWTQIWLAVTGLFGLVFVVLEGVEFANLVRQGYGPQRSAFLSAFFTLVGCHGTHVSVGLLWLGTMMAQIYVKGFRETIQRRMLCFNLFWHALDIIWVALFTVVYLLGAR